MRFGRCITLTSVARFDDPVVIGRDAAVFPGRPSIPEARSPSTPGPLLKFGPHRDGVSTFLEIRSFPGNLANDHIRISGFRIYGPTFGQQETGEVAIRIIRSIDITVANMEIAGWPEQGVKVDDDLIQRPARSSTSVRTRSVGGPPSPTGNLSPSGKSHPRCRARSR